MSDTEKRKRDLLLVQERSFLFTVPGDIFFGVVHVYGPQYQCKGG